QATLDQRYPKLPRGEAEKWLRRYREGRGPYARIRLHASGCQLDAVVALALHLGLRLSEIFRASVNGITMTRLARSRGTSFDRLNGDFIRQLQQVPVAA